MDSTPGVGSHLCSFSFPLFPFVICRTLRRPSFFLTLHTSKQKLQSPTVPVVVRVVCDRYRLAKKEPKFESFFFPLRLFSCVGFRNFENIIAISLVRSCAQ